jgi:hypothetical protein
MAGRFKIIVAIAASLAALWGTAVSALPQPADSTPLHLEAKILLGDVEGRIDHMAIDLSRQRLFIAELGNNSVSVVNLKDRKVLRRIAGLNEPQGVGYVQSTDTLYVANGGDGTVRLFQGETYADAEHFKLSSDADNIRVDRVVDHVIVGYGNGALAMIDAASRKRIADLPLKGHPESFQLSRDETKIFVNVPDTHEVAIIDRSFGKQTASWPTGKASGNFPMTLDDDSGRVFIVFRYPTKLGVFAMADGESVATLDVCRDADDIFFDAKRHRLYVNCGDGSLDVIKAQGGFRRIALVPTSAGARTALFVPELDRLFLAV